MNQKHPSNRAACNAAIELAMAGYGVFPVHLAKKPGEEKKLPNYGGGSWYDNIEFGPPDVEARFEAMPGANAIGVATGQSGVVGIDIDVSKGKDGYAALKDAGIELPSTPMRIRTWSGGMHYYFRAPDIPIRNKTNCPVAGVDVRGDGGHLYAPGSFVDDSEGARYEVAEGARIVPVDELPVLPAEWVELLTGPARKRVRLEDPIEIDPDRYSEKGKADIGRWIERELDKARKAPGLPHHDDEKPSVLSVSSSLSLLAQWLGWSFEDSLDMFLDAYQEGGREDLDDVRKTFEGDWAKVPRREPPSAELAGNEARPVTEDDGYKYLVAQEVRSKDARDEAKRIRANRNRNRFEIHPADYSEDLGEAEDYVLAENLLATQGFSFLVGRRGVGKSFLAVDIGLSVAHGVPWVGGWTRPGKVLYIAAESRIPTRMRIQAWLRNRGLPPRCENFVFHDDTATIPDLLNKEARDELKQQVKLHGIDLLILDTFTDFVKITTYDEEGGLPGLGRDLMDFGCSVLFLVHPNRGNSEIPGGNVLDGKCEYAIELKEEDRGFSFRSLKSRWFEVPQWEGTCVINSHGVVEGIDLGVKGKVTTEDDRRYMEQHHGYGY